MKHKRLMIVLVAVVFVLASLSLEAGFRNPRQMKHMQSGIRMAQKNLYPGYLLLRVKDKLALGDDQVKKIETLTNAHREQMIKEEAELKIQMTRFENYLNGEELNRKKIEKMIRSMADFKVKNQISRINHLLDLKEILTPEQQKKMEDLKSEFRRGRRGHPMKNKDNFHRRMK